MDKFFPGGTDESGLLEQPALLLGRPAGPRRGLYTSAGVAVGFAEWRPSVPGWLGWLRPVLFVHEELDQPLLCSVQRSLVLLPRREVLDAEQERVGVVAWPWLLDRWGQPVIEARATPGRKVLFLGLGRQMLGDCLRRGDGLRLEFAPAVRHDPFLKMLLLAAALHAPAGRAED
jgi:hypothetical protein